MATVVVWRAALEDGLVETVVVWSEALEDGLTTKVLVSVTVCCSRVEDGGVEVSCRMLMVVMITSRC